MGKRRRHSRQRSRSQPRMRSQAKPAESREEPADKERSDSSFWDFWRFADEAEDIRRNVGLRAAAAAVTPIVGGLLVLCLVALAVTRAPTSTTGSSASDRPSEQAAPPTTRDTTDGNPVEAARPADTRDPQATGTTTTTAPPAATEQDEPVAAPETVLVQSSEPAGEGGTPEPASSADVPPNIVNQRVPASPEPSAGSTPSPAPVEAPEPPAVVTPPDAGRTTTVSTWCVLDAVGTTGVGCLPGSTQHLELVDVATVDPVTVAVWCVPQVTAAGMAECGPDDTYLLEVLAPATVVPAPSAAPNDPTAVPAPADPTIPASPDTAPPAEPGAPATGSQGGQHHWGADVSGNTTDVAAGTTHCHCVDQGSAVPTTTGAPTYASA